MDINEAYKTLGLQEGATREEVNKRFDLLIRQARSRERSSDDQSDPNISQAYRQIIEHENALIIEQKRRERYSKWGKFAGPVEKWDDFLRIHRAKIVWSIIALIVVIAGISTYLNHQKEQVRLAKLPPIDLSIMFIGNFVLPETSQSNENLEKSLLNGFPEWKRISAKVSYLPLNTSQMDQTTLALQQKAQLDVMTERPDLYIMDKASFDWMTQGQALLNLDSLVDQNFKSVLPKGAGLEAKTEKDPSVHIYGIDLKNSPLAASLLIGSTDMIAGIRDGQPISEKTLQFLKHYLAAKPKS